MRHYLSDPGFWSGAREWLIGVGTLGTLIVSVVVLKRQRAELDAQAHERRQESAYQRSRQARQVTLNVDNLGGDGDGDDVEHMIYTPKVSIVNNSDEAVYDIELGMIVDGNVLLTSGDWVATTPVLAAGKALTHQISFRVDGVASRKDDESFEVLPFIAFTDQADQEWRRGHDLKLKLVKGAASRT